MKRAKRNLWSRARAALPPFVLSGICLFSLPLWAQPVDAGLAPELSGREVYSAGEQFKALGTPPAPTASTVRLPVSEQEGITQGRLRRSRSAWRVGFFNLVSSGLQDVRTGEGRLGAYNFVSFDYRIDYNQRLSLRPQFTYDGAGKDFRGEMQPENWRMGDLYLQYSHYNLGLIGGELGVAGSVRLYIPNSENSRRSGNISQLQTRLFFTSDLPGPWYWTYHFYPKYYLQSQRSYVTEFGQLRGNRRAELEHKLEFSYRGISSWGLSQSMGLKHQWHYSSPANSLDELLREFVNIELSAVVFLEATSIRLGLSNEIPLQGARQPDFRLFREEQMKLVAMTYVSF